MRNQRYLDAAALKEAIHPHDFYLREQNLSRFAHKSGGWSLAGICPFHDDTKAGSFKVNLETGAFKCWSCGASGGDIIAFLQKRDGLSFIEALRNLSQEWRI
jgi:DNA primase